MAQQDAPLDAVVAEESKEHGEPAPLLQAAFIGALKPPSFQEQLNGALRRLSRSGHTVMDVKLLGDGATYSALVLCRFGAPVAERKTT